MIVLKRPFIAVTICLLLARIGTAQLVTNPIPAPVVKGSVRIRIDNLVQMPATVSTLGSKPDNSPSARARINFLHESPDGRLFVNDLRGQLYTLDQNSQPHLYLDIDSANGGSGLAVKTRAVSYTRRSCSFPSCCEPFFAQTNSPASA